MFIGYYTNVEWAFTTPPYCCCNCGDKRLTSYVETPLKRVRYFFFSGSEVTLNAEFPYCKKCKRSAARIRSGFIAQLLAACMVIAAVFYGLALTADAMPNIISDNMFYSACIVGALLTRAYFYLRKKRRANGSTYYQPIDLVDIELDETGLSYVHLRFYNRKYATIFSAAHADLIEEEILRVEVAPKHKG